MARKINKRLGELLTEANILSPEQLSEALSHARSQPGKRLGSILVEKGYISETKLQGFLSEQLRVPIVDLKKTPPDATLASLVPSSLIRKHRSLPFSKQGDILTVVTTDPLNIFAVDDFEELTGLEVKLALASDTDIETLMQSRYGVDEGMTEILGEIDKLNAREGARSSEESLAKLTEETPVVRLVNTTLATAIKQRASDIHLEHGLNSFLVRFRIDGILYEAMRPPVDVAPLIVSRLKVMADLDIAERRMPQDGRFQSEFNGRDVDFRVSTSPTIHGENMVIRILSKGPVVESLDKVGFSHAVVEGLRTLVNKPQGLLLVTGPTGSGKTSTLYAGLNTINTMSRKIITIEDPVEFKFNLVNQIPVNRKLGLTFAEGVRSVLRLDPDVIMVGEMRDPETAMLAIEAALTGHLVLSTLHTNDAVGTISRLTELGVEPYLINSSISGIVAQRLVRLNCPNCKTTYTPPTELLRSLGLPENGSYFRGKGCEECHRSGFRGRSVISELLVFNDEIRTLITNRATSDTISQAAVKAGMTPILKDGARLVSEGLTTAEELARVATQVEH